jgi:hypothetical protein
MLTRSLRLRRLTLFAACLTACGDAGSSPADAGARADGSAPSSAEPDATDTASPHDASITGEEDAGGALPDASPSTSCGLTETVRFSWAGGFRGSRDLYTLTPPSALVITRISAQGQDDDEAGEVLCTSSLACEGKGVDASALIAALSSAEVSSAFQPTPTLFGIDRRPVDGAVLRVSRMDGSVIEIGDECPEPAAGCNPITPALRELADQLMAFMEAVRPGDAGQCATGP